MNINHNTGEQTMKSSNRIVLDTGEELVWVQIAERRYEAMNGDLAVYGIGTALGGYGGPEVVWYMTWTQHLEEGVHQWNSRGFNTLAEALQFAERSVAE
jgi:hypothetical protein